jgi:hypothetical protein
LLQLCREAVKTKNPNLISPREGFFFGSTEVDEYYWGDIQQTIEIINHVLKNTPDDYNFLYQSSW